jgi:hypothetical protein
VVVALLQVRVEEPRIAAEGDRRLVLLAEKAGSHLLAGKGWNWLRTKHMDWQVEAQLVKRCLSMERTGC